MAEQKPEAIAPQPDDPSDVAVALETANALWDNGDTTESLRWIRRAAASAEEAGNDLRSLALARAAADITESLGAPARPSPLLGKGKASQPPPPSMRGGPSKPPPPPSARASVPPARGSGQVSAPPPPPSARASAPPPRASKSPSAPPPPPSARGSVPPRGSKPAAGSVPPAARAPKAAAASTSAARQPSKQGARSSKSKASLPPPPRSNGKDDTARAVKADGEGLHVSVKPSVRDPNLLLVRILPKGQRPPAGTHEAVLTALESGTDLTRAK